MLQAERHLRAAVAADHDFTQAVLELAFIDEERGDYAAALRAYRAIGVGADQGAPLRSGGARDRLRPRAVRT